MPYLTGRGGPQRGNAMTFQSIALIHGISFIQADAEVHAVDNHGEDEVADGECNRIRYASYIHIHLYDY